MDARQPLVSVIMNCLNGERYLREAIDSVFAQTYLNWEIVFYDNASTDASAAIARSYGEKVKYFRGDDTLPLGAARNAAIAQARGELIAFLDTDDRWLPDKLTIQVDAMTEDSHIDFIYTNCHVLGAASGRTHLCYRRQQPQGLVFREFLRYYPVNLQTVMIRRSTLDAMDTLFDPALHVSEEYDLFIRLLYRSKACYVHKPTAIYRVHGAMASIRHVDKYPVENQAVLDKLRRLIPDLDSVYSQEVAYLEAKIGYWYAVAYMQRGARREAREALAPHRRDGAAFGALYLLTFFPAAVWQTAQRLNSRWRSVWT